MDDELHCIGMVLGGNGMKRNEKLVFHGNEFYLIDLDCLEKKKYLLENMGKENTEGGRKRKGKKKMEEHELKDN